MGRRDGEWEGGRRKDERKGRKTGGTRRKEKEVNIIRACTCSTYFDHTITRLHACRTGSVSHFGILPVGDARRDLPLLLLLHRHLQNVTFQLKICSVLALFPGAHWLFVIYSTSDEKLWTPRNEVTVQCIHVCHSVGIS